MKKKVKGGKGTGNPTGLQVKDVKLSPGSPGTNQNNPLTQRKYASATAKLVARFKTKYGR